MPLTWFVTLVLQLVIVFPLMHWMARGRGLEWLLVAGLASTTASALLVGPVIDFYRSALASVPPDGFLAWPVGVTDEYFYWIFPPLYLWNVAAGIWLARRGSMNVATVALASVAWTVLVVSAAALGSFIPAGEFTARLGRNLLTRVADVPLALLVLLVAGRMPLPAVASRFLAWCGAASWGLYLGHLLVYDLAFRLGLEPGRFGVAWRVGYAIVLLGAGAWAVFAGEALRRRLAIGPLTRVFA